MQLPDGASLSRTRAVVEQVEDMLRPSRRSQNVLVDRRLLPDRRRRPVELRLHGRAAEAVRDRDGREDSVQRRDRPGLRRRRSRCARRNVFAFNLPPIIGLRTGGGFEYQLQNLEGRDPAEMAASCSA